MRLQSWMIAGALVAATTLVGVGAEPQNPPLPGAPGAVPAPRQLSTTLIDVDYPGTNLRMVLRALAQIGGIGIAIDPSVSPTATVDLQLTQVPWDEVLNVVLKSNQLVTDQQPNVMRVLTREAQTKEFDDQSKQKKASEQAPDLKSLKVRLNYATAATVAKLLDSAGFKSDRGSIDFEDRTNMLIVKDLPQNVEEIRILVAELDQPEPQVEIEARIIQTNNDTARALGVQWGFNGRVSPELGNTTNLTFPNSGSLGGRVQGAQGSTSQGPADVRATPLQTTATAVDLAVPGASSGLGLSMGAINGALNLDIALSALEKKGKLKIVSTPHITTQNNKQAEVTQGFEIPYQVVTNNTVTVQFKDAALKLVVTPQVTAANTVIMKISLENAAPDLSRGVNGNPAIRTDRAETQVQVPDGLTTVIGGIKQVTDQDSSSRTPGLGNIPLLGWLFRNNSTSSVEQELLIFITPKIVREQPRAQ